MFESPCGRHNSECDGTGGSRPDVCWSQELGSRFRGPGSRHMLKGQYDQDLMVQAILLLMACGHTASWEQTPPLHYGEACPPAKSASQPASNSPSEHTTHHTPNIRIQPTLEHSSPPGSGMTGRHFCCFCGQLLWSWHLLSVCQARCGSMLLRRRVFRAFVAYLLNQAVNPTHVPFFS